MLTPTQRTFLRHEQTIAPAIINLILNAGLAWLLFRHQQPIPLWGGSSIAGDMLATLFVLPFLTCLTVTPLVRHAARTGKVERLAIEPAEHRLLRLLPRSTWARGALVGLASLLLFGPPALLVLSALDVQSLSLAAAVPFKGVFAAVLAALVTPLLALYALAREQAAG